MDSTMDKNLDSKRIKTAKMLIKNFELRHKPETGSSLDFLLTGLYIILDNASNSELDKEIQFQETLLKKME